MTDLSIPLIIVLMVGLCFAEVILFFDVMIWYDVVEKGGHCIYESDKNIAGAEFYSIIFAMTVLGLLIICLIYGIVMPS